MFLPTSIPARIELILLLPGSTSGPFSGRSSGLPSGPPVSPRQFFQQSQNHDFLKIRQAFHLLPGDPGDLRPWPPPPPPRLLFAPLFPLGLVVPSASGRLPRGSSFPAPGPLPL